MGVVEGYPCNIRRRRLSARQHSRGDLSSWPFPSAGCRDRTPAVGVRSGKPLRPDSSPSLSGAVSTRSRGDYSRLPASVWSISTSA